MVVPLHVFVFDEWLVLIYTLYPLHAVQFEPSFLSDSVTLFVLAPSFAAAVSVPFAPTLNVVFAVVALVIVFDVVDDVQMVPLSAYPEASVATIVCIALLDPNATTVPPAVNDVPLNVIVAFVNAPVIV